MQRNVSLCKFAKGPRSMPTYHWKQLHLYISCNCSCSIYRAYLSTYCARYISCIKFVVRRVLCSYQKCIQRVHRFSWQSGHCLIWRVSLPHFPPLRIPGALVCHTFPPSGFQAPTSAWSVFELQFSMQVACIAIGASTYLTVRIFQSPELYLVSLLWTHESNGPSWKSLTSVILCLSISMFDVGIALENLMMAWFNCKAWILWPAGTNVCGKAFSDQMWKSHLSWCFPLYPWPIPHHLYQPPKGLRKHSLMACISTITNY